MQTALYPDFGFKSYTAKDQVEIDWSCRTPIRLGTPHNYIRLVCKRR
jgi:hypothetical protein